LLAEAIRAKRQLELQSTSHGFVPAQNKRKNFIEFFKDICESKKKNSRSNYIFWTSVQAHLIKFAGETVPFSEIDERFCERFKNHLLFESELAQNSASLYFDYFKSAINRAFERHFFAENPCKNVKSIKMLDVEREFLSLDELKKISGTNFQPEVIKRAALFSALTGLRFSDLRKLTWAEVRHNNENGYFIQFRQQKTKALEILPISEEAFLILGERGRSEDRVFSDLSRWKVKYYLPKLITAAGIDRTVTFHGFRHTYATLQLTFGTDIYVVSKMLGHKKIETTKIYARIVDEKKREAANRISLK